MLDITICYSQPVCISHCLTSVLLWNYNGNLSVDNVYDETEAVYMKRERQKIDDGSEYTSVSLPKFSLSSFKVWCLRRLADVNKTIAVMTMEMLLFCFSWSSRCIWSECKLPSLAPCQKTVHIHVLFWGPYLLCRVQALAMILDCCPELRDRMVSFYVAFICLSLWFLYNERHSFAFRAISQQ